MYDHQTRTLWNQLSGEPVLGELVGSGVKLDLLPVVVTTWEDWLTQHPDTVVLDLNTGYQRIQGVVLRAGDRNSGFEPEVFRVYGPKVIATRKRFADWALESRCLTQEMGGPTMRLDIPIDLPMAFWEEEAPQIRGSCLTTAIPSDTVWPRARSSDG